jgi:chromosome segregation ATPase
MSHNLNELSSSVQNLGKQYAAVIKVGEFLSSLSSFDNLACEIEARVEKAKQAETAATEQLHKIEAAVAEQAATHERNIKTSREQAEAFLAGAVTEGNAVIDAANAKAEQIDAGARARLEAHDADFVRVTEHRDALNAEVERARVALEDLHAQIAKVRAKFA